MSNEQSSLKVTLKKSISGRLPGHAESVRGLGLRKIGQSVVVKDHPANRGMIAKAHYLLDVEVLNASE
jgi:large subunit ribosomal protein L30